MVFSRNARQEHETPVVKRAAECAGRAWSRLSDPQHPRLGGSPDGPSLGPGPARHCPRSEPWAQQHLLQGQRPSGQKKRVCADSSGTEGGGYSGDGRQRACGWCWGSRDFSGSSQARVPVPEDQRNPIHDAGGGRTVWAEADRILLAGWSRGQDGLYTWRNGTQFNARAED